jgi:hypothetical protein
MISLCGSPSTRETWSVFFFKFTALRIVAVFWTSCDCGGAPWYPCGARARVVAHDLEHPQQQHSRKMRTSSAICGRQIQCKDFGVLVHKQGASGLCECLENTTHRGRNRASLVASLVVGWSPPIVVGIWVALGWVGVCSWRWCTLQRCSPSLTRAVLGFGLASQATICAQPKPHTPDHYQSYLRPPLVIGWRRS